MPHNSKILSFFAAGPKCYSLVYEKDDGSVVKEVKAKGFFLRGSMAKEQLNSDVLENCVENFVDYKEVSVAVNQFEISTDKKRKTLQSKTNQKQFRVTFNKRVALRHVSDRYATAPFGYKTVSLLPSLPEKQSD